MKLLLCYCYSMLHAMILTLPLHRPLSYRNQSINLLSKSMDWLLYDRDLRHKRVKDTLREKGSSNKTLALRKSTNMDVWAVAILNQLFIRGYWQNSVPCDRPILQVPFYLS